MPEGGLGVPLNHPRFLQWLGVPDSAWLLEMSPAHWCDTLSRDQAMSAAMQLHRDACLMQTNLDILDQYALALHGIENVTENNWGRPIPKSGGSSRSTGTTRTSSLGANGGLGTLETFAGPSAVRDGTSLTSPASICSPASRATVTHSG